MVNEPRPDLDRRLAEAFEPDAHVVSRVMRAAAAGEEPVRRYRRRRLRLAWASLAALAITAGGAAYWRLGPGVPAVPPDALVLSGSCDGDGFVMSAPDGSISVSGPGTRDERPTDGAGIVLVEGGLE